MSPSFAAGGTGECNRMDFIDYIDDELHECIECGVNPCDCDGDELACNLCYDCRHDEDEVIYGDDILGDDYYDEF